MKNLPERKKRVLCSNVDRLVILAGQIQDPNFDRGLISKDLIETAKEIHSQALAMEKRLYLYKETIEGLGFKRVRGK